MEYIWVGIVFAVLVLGIAVWVKVVDDEEEIKRQKQKLSEQGITPLFDSDTPTGETGEMQGKEEVVSRINELKSRGLTYYVDNALHVYGLPIPEGAHCVIMSFPSSLEFQFGTTSITLDREQITDICVMTETELQQHYTSSFSSAVKGAIFFGISGAVIGSRLKSEPVNVTKHLLVITYKTANSELSFVGFNVNSCLPASNNVAAEFHRLNPDAQTHIKL